MINRYSLASRASRDIEAILETSADRWGTAARDRYQQLLVAALDRAAADPLGPLTIDRAEIRPGLRSLALRRLHDAKVRQPVHIVLFRLAGDRLIEVVRIRHERMNFGRHLA